MSWILAGVGICIGILLAPYAIFIAAWGLIVLVPLAAFVAACVAWGARYPMECLGLLFVAYSVAKNGPRDFFLWRARRRWERACDRYNALDSTDGGKSDEIAAASAECECACNAYYALLSENLPDDWRDRRAASDTTA